MEEIQVDQEQQQEVVVEENVVELSLDELAQVGGGIGVVSF
jgi:hypothetical protein